MAIHSYAKGISDLAQKAIKEGAKKGIKCDRMCDECAFKWNQPHTLQYILAADNAANCLLSGTEFNCHTHDYKCAGHRCAGFDIVKKVFGDTYEK